MKAELTRKKQLTGLLYGLIAGVSFAIFAWGIDGFFLARANGAFPWIKFVPGLLICASTGGLVGWLTIRFQTGWLTMPLWIALAWLFARLAVWLPIQGTPLLLRPFDSDLSYQLTYTSHPEFIQYFWFGLIATLIAAVICGLMENVLIEQSFFSTGVISTITPVIICMLCFGLAGLATDSMLNSYLRKPVQVVNELMQFAVDNTGKEVPGDVARAMHLAATKTISDFLPLERRLMVRSFDQSLFQISVLIDFDNKWAECLTISDQVTICQPIVRP